MGDMFQHKIDEIFKDMPNVFGIADDILVIGYDKDGADHDEAVYKVLWQCQYVNLKLNKDKCHFRCTCQYHSLVRWCQERASSQTHAKDQSSDQNAWHPKTKRSCRLS